MTAVLLRAGSELRARLASMLALTLLLGLSAGAVITLAAGARRTDSAYSRFERQYLAGDMLIYPPFDPRTFADIPFETIAKLPQVIASGRQRFLGATDPNIAAIAPDATFGKTVDRPKILEGRMPRNDAIDEAAVSFVIAQKRHLRVGATIAIDFVPKSGEPIPTRLRIVGVEASPGEFPPQLGGFGTGDGGVVHVSQALFASLEGKLAFAGDFLVLRFRRGAADFGAVNNELSKLAGDLPQLNQNLGAQATNVQRSIHLQAVALRIVAALVALIALLVLSQLVARQAAIDATSSPILRALGMTRWQVSAVGLLRSAMIGVAAAIIAVVTAVTASPLMPVGIARVAEPSGGVALDAFVLTLGAGATIVLMMVLAAWPLWRYSSEIPERHVGSTKRSLASRSAALTKFSPAMTTGVSLALESGRGRTAVPVRSSLMSVVLAIIGLAAALTFGAGLDHLLKTPSQYGWNWDAHITTNDEESDMTAALKVLDSDPKIAALALVDTPPVTLDDDIPFDAISLLQHKGDLQPRILEGRTPRAANEIAVGPRTLREAHKGIGSKVHVSISAISGGGADFTVVGTVVVPPNSDTTRLGSGGVVTRDGELAMIPKTFTGIPPLTDAYLRFAPGVDQDRAIRAYRGQFKDHYDVLLPSQPRDLVNFGQVQNLPLLLAGMVAVLAAATLAQTLITSIRRRRRDLAILKMLGFRPRQVRWAVTWQATTFVSAALVIGLPIGVIVGRSVWTVFAKQLGVPPEPATPSIQLLLTVPIAVLLANVIATIPGMIAGAMKPAPALRAE